MADKLDQALRQITLGVVRDMESRRAQKLIEGLLEREENFVIPVSGFVGQNVQWSEMAIKFGTVFVSAEGQRDSQLIRPHVTSGAYVPIGGPVILDACVTEWNVTSKDETVGCTIMIGAHTTDESRKFEGELHVRFQGYGAPADPYGDPSMYDVG